MVQKGGVQNSILPSFLVPCKFTRLFHHLLFHVVKEDNTWQLRQLKNGATSPAGPPSERASSRRMKGFPGDKPSSSACNTCWPCLGQPCLPRSLWALILTPQFSSPALAPSFSLPW